MGCFRRYLMISGIAAYVFGITGVCSAGVVVQGEKKVDMKSAPVATAVATGGKMVFVLTDKGTVEIYTDTGALKGTINVGMSATGIATSWGGNKLYVTDRGKKDMKIISLDFVADFNTEGSPSKGPEDAPITIVEFSDFQCPYCSRVAPLMNRILKKYPTRVKLVFKNYPLTRIHKMAMKAAIASLAAKEQGRYWEYHDKLFENHKELSNEKLLDIARELGLDMAKFEHDMQDPKIVALIKRDTNEAQENDVRGTPTLFLNGHKLGSLNLSYIEKAIAQELKKVCAERKKQASAARPSKTGQSGAGGFVILDSDPDDL
jgi:protein-disulfide isomerase